VFDDKALNTEIKPVVEIIIIAVVLLKQGYKISRYFSVVFSKVAPNVRKLFCVIFCLISKKPRVFALTRGHAFNARRKNKQFIVVIGICGSLSNRDGRQSRPSRLLKIQKNGRTEKSIFRLGLETLRTLFLPNDNKL
jgi:hypothetical protein